MNKRMKLLSLLLAGGVLTAGGLLGAYAGERTTDTFAEQEMTGEMRRMAQQEELPAEEPVSNEGEEAEQVQTDIPEVAENETVLVQSEYADIAVAQVNNYVNVRSEPNTESEILGKLYHNSAATVLEATEDGWYRIKSGNVEGYVKSEYVVVGDEELARAVGTRYATVTTTTLFVRSEPSIEARILTMLPEGDDLEVLDESLDGWALVSTVEGDGYVSKDYVEFSTEYITAESREEEAARLAKEEAERKAAAEAAAAARRAREEEQRKAAAAAQTGSSSAGSSSAGSSSAGSSSAGNSSAGNSSAGNSSAVNSAGNGGLGSAVPQVSNGQAVVDYAMQFLGNPYVYGGNSLTNGTDCSGFVKGVYEAFGVSLPRHSAAQREVGYAVSLSDILPGDIVCYSGHVGIYAGNNTLIHASNEKSGITLTSPVTYRKVLAVRRIF